MKSIRSVDHGQDTQNPRIGMKSLGRTMSARMTLSGWRVRAGSLGNPTIDNRSLTAVGVTFVHLLASTRISETTRCRPRSFCNLGLGRRGG